MGFEVLESGNANRNPECARYRAKSGHKEALERRSRWCKRIEYIIPRLSGSSQSHENKKNVIIGMGVDLAEVQRIWTAIERHG
jgi:hypothetical protein